MDLLLIAPPLLWGNDRLDFKPPMNLLYLHAYLGQQGKSSTVLDCVSEGLDLERTVARVLELRPRAVGVPLYHATLETTFALLRRLREVAPDLPLVGGGPTFSIEPEKFLASGLFDVGILGEGEETLLEVLEALARGDRPEIPGAAWWHGDHATMGPPRPAMRDLDALPFLDFSPLAMDVYFAYQQRMGIPPTWFMTTSRGCAYRCTYCTTPMLWPGKVRRLSPARVLAEIAHHARTFPGASVGFLDDSFFADRVWLEEFIRGVADLGVNYTCIGRIDHLDPELIDAIAASGCTYVAVGVETGNQLRQRRLKKHLSLDKLRRNITEFARHDLTTKCFFMLGFPDETLDEMAETINLAVELKTLGMGTCSFFPVIVYPGTELAATHGVLEFASSIHPEYAAHLPTEADPGHRGLSMYSTVPCSDSNPHLSHGQLVELVNLAYRKVDRREPITQEEIAALAR